MPYPAGTPLWALHLGVWRPAVCRQDDDAATVGIVFVDATEIDVPRDAVELFDATNTERINNPAISEEIAAFASAASQAEEGESSSDDDDETEAAPTQEAELGDDDAQRRKLDKRAKKALKKEKKRQEKADKKSKKDKHDKKEKKARAESQDENDDELLGVTTSTKEKKSKRDKHDKKSKKEKKSKREKKEKRRRHAEASETHDTDDEDSDFAEESSDDEPALRSYANIPENVPRLRSGDQYRGSQRVTPSGPVIPMSATDLIMERAQHTRDAFVTLSVRDALLTQPHLSSVAQQLSALQAFYKSEVAKLAMGTISAGTGMTASVLQVMPISEVEYLKAAERKLSAHRNTLRVLQCAQAALIKQFRDAEKENATEFIDELSHRIQALASAIKKEAEYNVLEQFKLADEEAKHPNGPMTCPGIPNLRPIRNRRPDERDENVSSVRHHHFSYIDPICEPSSGMQLKAVATIPTVASKVQGDELRRRELESMLQDRTGSSFSARGFDLGSMLPNRLKGSIDGMGNHNRSSNLSSLLAGTSSSLTGRGNVAPTRVMTQWRTFRDIDLSRQSQQQTTLQEYLTTNRVQDVLPPNATARHFDFGGKSLDERAQRHAQHLITRATQGSQLLADPSSLSINALLRSSTSNLLADPTQPTPTQQTAVLNITDFGVSRNLKTNQSRRSGMLMPADEAEMASVYSSVDMDSVKSFDVAEEGGGLAPAEFGIDIQNVFKSEMVDPGYPDLNDMKDTRAVKSVDLPSVNGGGSSAAIDTNASSYKEYQERKPANGLNADPEAQNVLSPANTARNIIRDVLVAECRTVFNKIKTLLAEAARKGDGELVVAGGTTTPVTFSLHRLESLQACLATTTTLKMVVSTLRDRIAATPEIQACINAFYAENDASTQITASKLIPVQTQQRIRGSLLSYLSRQYGIPETGLHSMRLQRRRPQEAPEAAPGERRPRQEAYAYHH